MKRSSVKVRHSPKGWIEYDITVVWPNGEDERERRQCPRQSMGAAKDWAQLRWKEVFDLGPPSSRKQASRLTWSTFMIEFRRLHYVNGPRGKLKPSQIASIESHWEQHIKPFWGSQAIEDVTTKAIVEWLAVLQAPCTLRNKKNRERSPKTIKNILTTFNTMIERAERWDLVTRGIARAPIARIDKPNIEFYTFVGFDNLLEAAKTIGQDAELVVLLGGRAGLRVGEMLALETADLHPTKNELLIQRSTWNGETGTTKSGKGRRIPISASLAEAIRARKDGFVLAYPNGKPATLGRLRKMMIRVERAAKEVGATGKLHKLRHTFASHLVMMGVPIVVVKELLGHENIETTMRYAHLEPNAKERAIRALHGEEPETTQSSVFLMGKNGGVDGTRTRR